jgi:hypothetical protein
MTTKRAKTPVQFVLCVDSDDPELLTPRMVYQVLPDEEGGKSGYVRIVDNEGEDYLYPSRFFVAIDFPQTVKRTLLRKKTPALQGSRTGRGRV